MGSVENDSICWTHGKVVEHVNFACGSNHGVCDECVVGNAYFENANNFENLNV